MGSSKKSARNLYAAAARQQGVFSAKQAKAAGYRDSVHGYHVRNADWEKLRRGIYRLVQYPPAPGASLVVWSLWSRDRNEKPQGVFSHDTALRIHRGDPSLEGPFHLTVSPSFRKGTPIPKEIVLHVADLEETEIEEREGYRVTSLRRTQDDTRPPRREAREEVAAPPPPGTRPAVKVEKPEAGDWAVW